MRKTIHRITILTQKNFHLAKGCMTDLTDTPKMPKCAKTDTEKQQKQDANRTCTNQNICPCFGIFQ